jgi:hypothetical protein
MPKKSSSYPFTAPAEIPSVKYLWNTIKIISIGIAVKVAVA